MVWNRPFVCDTWEDSTHLIRSWGDRAFSYSSGLSCSYLEETELQSILLKDAASSQCDSFSGKMDLKRPFLSKAVEDSARLFGSLEDRVLSHSPGRCSLELLQYF